MVRPPTRGSGLPLVGDRDGDHDLIGARRIVDLHLHAVEMASHERRVLVAERNVQDGSHAAAFLGRRNQRRTLAQDFAHRRTHLRMQDGCGVLEFAVFTHRRRLAVTLRLGAVDAQRGNRLF
jgi:hypothetical protein